MPSGRDLRMPWPSDQARPGSQPHRYLWSQRGDPWQSESMHSLEAAIVQRSTKLAPRIMAIDKQRHRLTHYYSGPICARAFKIWILRDLSSRGHHDWPVMPTTRPEGDQRELLWLRNSFLVSFFPCTPSSANVPGSATTRSTQTPRRSHPRPRTTSWAVARDSDSETWRRSIHHQFRHDACRGGSAARLWMRGRLLSKSAKVPLK